MSNDTAAIVNRRIAGKRPQGDLHTRWLDNERNVIRCKHYSIRTKYSYIEWIKRYVCLNHKRHPEKLNERHIP